MKDHFDCSDSTVFPADQDLKTLYKDLGNFMFSQLKIRH